LAGGYVYREWLPNAKQAGSGSPGWKTSDFVLHRNTDRGGNASPAESISALFREVFLIGNFNDWQNTTPLTSEGYGRWALLVKDKVPDIVRWGVENDT